MDLQDLRNAVTVVSFVVFIGNIAWTWARQRKAGFDEAANLPFLDNDGERK